MVDFISSADTEVLFRRFVIPPETPGIVISHLHPKRGTVCPKNSGNISKDREQMRIEIRFGNDIDGCTNVVGFRPCSFGRTNFSMLRDNVSRSGICAQAASK